MQTTMDKATRLKRLIAKAKRVWKSFDRIRRSKIRAAKAAKALEFNPKKPYEKGYCIGKRWVRQYKGSSRPRDLTPEEWMYMSPSYKKKDIERYRLLMAAPVLPAPPLPPPYDPPDDLAMCPGGAGSNDEWATTCA